MRILVILLLSLLLTAGCAVETPYYGYGPYYGPYYEGPYYGYYGSYFYHDFDRGHHEFGENHESGEGGMHAHR